MRKDDTGWGFFVGVLFSSLIHAVFMAAASNMLSNEKGLLRFCMTHSIPLEQCKIPDEGE